ncbi:GNAT family N-acetyltransferase [Frigidibacter oleivorans]|uniref:GNAT family N-acetyltransferase n=1 Tax=Frigidibacter oleivorans TaxID=2487129 RepID=UPI000F8F6BF6|nr:GNAT family N-acetyltransferase [Frigidibacter oleivorans]
MPADPLPAECVANSVADSLPLVLRPAEPRDLPAIAAFWNPMIRDTAVTFSADERSVEALAAMLDARRAAGCEMFVAALGPGPAMGFATYAPFRPGSGYLRTMEHTIILSPALQGRGAGRALIAAVADHARAGGALSLIAAVSGENAAGIAFHRAAGFAEVGRIPAAGWKFGRSMDLVLLQLRL